MLQAETSEDLHEWKAALEEALAQAPSATLVMGQNGIFRSDQADALDGSVDQCMFLCVMVMWLELASFAVYWHEQLAYFHKIESLNKQYTIHSCFQMSCLGHVVVCMGYTTYGQTSTFSR